jgi:FAD/FMN-containing dehydrogenase
VTLASDEVTRLAAFAQGCIAGIGQKFVLREAEELSPYAIDFLRQHQGRAAYVVRPGTTAEVAQVVSLAARHQIQLIVQAGNTGLVNGSIPDASGRQVVLSINRLNSIRAVEAAGDYLVAEAGCVLADVQRAATDAGRLFPLSLGAEGSCRIGGTLATNAGGNNALRYGSARDLVLGLEVVLPDGTIWDGLRTLRKDNSGYDLKQLFIGSEGTLGVITAATLRLVSAPRERATLWMCSPSAESALGLFAHFRYHFGDLISSFELIHSNGVETALRHLAGVRRPVSEPYPWHVLAEIAWSFEGGLRTKVEQALGQVFEEGLCLDASIAESEQQRLNMWRIREGQSEAAREVGAVVRSDVSVSIDQIPHLLAETGAFVEQQNADVVFIPFGHVGDGNIHINFVVQHSVVDRLGPLLLDHLFDAVERRGGSISAEHGVGRSKRQAIRRGKSAVSLHLIERIRSTIDPQRTLNAGIGLA